MIPAQTITNILETAQIEDVINDFITLKKRGVNLIALCPFHNEKTPSFTVSPSKGIYKCFGCGAAGNAVKFLMEHEHYTYPEALRHLAEKYNIEIEEVIDNKEHQAEKDLHESLHIITGFAQEYYSELLLSNEEGQRIGLSYFKERGFREDTISKFQLGYCLNQADAFTKSALEKGYQLELLKKIGLVVSKNNKNSDFFKGRVLFPIHNLSGKIVAFAGRTLKNDIKSPKYINSPESDIYNKSRILYGISFAKRSIREKDECYIVEGYTDVISLNQAGIENVVASSGTSLTQEQVRLLKRYTPNATILYDGDEAGIKAALRGLELVIEEGLNVKIVLLPENEDPDSFIKNTGISGFQEYVASNAKDFLFFKTDLLLKDAEKDPIKKTNVIKDIVETIAKVPDPIKRSLYCKECSTLLEISEQILITEINKIKRKTLQRKTLISQQEAEALEPDIQSEYMEVPYSSNVNEYQEKDIIRLLLEYGNKEIEADTTVMTFILSEIESITFENETYAAIIEEIKASLKEKKALSEQHFINHPNSEISNLAIEIFSSPYQISENWDKMHGILVLDKSDNFKKDVIKGITRFKQKQVQKMFDENQKRLREAQIKQNLKEVASLQQVSHRLNEWKQEIAKSTGTVVLK